MNNYSLILKKDPAARNDPMNILYGYTSFYSVLFYRISNWIILQELNKGNRLDCSNKLYKYALFLSKRGKELSNAEINSFAKIGNRFVLDHGIGTVIGETSVIGNDCYMLGGVILGAKAISNNPNGNRHPKIGNNVQIGSFSRILGNVNIGNNVVIGSNCLILEDIPDNHIVTLKTENYIVKELK